MDGDFVAIYMIACGEEVCDRVLDDAEALPDN
jgi:hypothetical protein